MNSNKVQTIINQIIAENRDRIGGKAARKQYAVAKWQITKLTELGIIELMPAGFGHSDADAVINEAGQSKTAVMNRYGEGEAVPASALYQALNEAEATANDEEYTETRDETDDLIDEVARMENERTLKTDAESYAKWELDNYR